MSKMQRGWLVTVAAVVVLAYTFYGSSAHGSDLDITVDFWGLLVFIAVLVFGTCWVWRAGKRGSS
jgi:NADH:ubiquinone oxidoreductase subunit 3 (subunit A)